MKLYSFCNLGNTCYINSILQCFINDPDFKNNVKNHLFHNLTDFIDFTDNNENINHRHNPMDIVKLFVDKFPLFQQHDAHEFLLEFLEVTGITYCYGKIKTNLICGACNNISSTIEDFSTLNLHLHADHENLTDSFMDYLKQEEIHEYHCDKCNCSQTAVKKTFLWILPKRLIVVLKKYSNIKQRLLYDNNIKIKETETGKVYEYKLYAVLYHYGNMDHGHYNCNVSINDKWYFINDETIYLNTDMENNNSNSYILFYRQNEI